jgi:putative hydrolase of the HAD superfamily
MTRLPDGVRVVFFDAVATLIHPEPGVVAAYHAAGGRHGSRLTPDEVRRRFRAAFAAQERLDAERRHRTDEGREEERWHEIVAAVFDDVSDFDGCFCELYDHFARPTAWRCDPAAAEVLAALRAAGYVVGVASNFDRRLRGVIAGLPELGRLDHLAISSEVGWKKPAPEFFAAAAAMAGLPPGEILLVGDDRENDFHGAKNAGMQALLIDPADVVTPRIRALGEMLDRRGPRR